MNLGKMIKIRVRGRNVNNYVKNMIKRKINFVEVIPVNRKEVKIVLIYDDYLKLIKYKSVLYEIEVIDRLGILRFREIIGNNKILIIFVMLGLGLLWGLSNIIFEVEVVHQDRNIRELIYRQLDVYGVKKYFFKKSYIELEEIEEEILKNNKDRLEWLEISMEGTKVVVRAEERIMNSEEVSYKYQSIVSKKNAVIREINASKGEVVKEEGIYVKKGDTVISGYIVHPDNSNGKVMAMGEVYGEVWYNVDIFYPFVYQESNLTGRSKSGITINFFDRELNLFSKDRYRTFSRKNKVLYRDNFLDFQVIFEKRYELDIKDEVYTEDLVENKAVSYIKDRMIKDNSDIREVESVKVLSKEVDYDGMRFSFFVTTIENVGEVVEIVEETLE